MPNVEKKKEVEEFLKEFKEKKQIWGVLFLDDRGKNFETLTLLELRPIEREKILEKLTLRHYCQGPLDEDWHGGKEMWVFGYHVREREVYIKITLGAPGSHTICISFHISEYPMEYPLGQ